MTFELIVWSLLIKKRIWTRPHGCRELTIYTKKEFHERIAADRSYLHTEETATTRHNERTHYTWSHRQSADHQTIMYPYTILKWVWNMTKTCYKSKATCCRSSYISQFASSDSTDLEIQRIKTALAGNLTEFETTGTETTFAPWLGPCVFHVQQPLLWSHAQERMVWDMVDPCLWHADPNGILHTLYFQEPSIRSDLDCDKQSDTS